MKTSFKPLALATVLITALGLATFAGGCASTSTKESTG